MSISYAVFCLTRPPPPSTLFPYTTLFRSQLEPGLQRRDDHRCAGDCRERPRPRRRDDRARRQHRADRHARVCARWGVSRGTGLLGLRHDLRSEEHTSELQSHVNLVCRLLLDTATTAIYTLSLHDALPISTGTRFATAG